jgi:hypothetical protein
VKLQYFLFLLALAISGCAALGPTTSPDFSKFVSAAMPANEGQIKFFAPSEWVPNVMGFTNLLSNAQTNVLIGVCVITDGSLIFLQWNDSLERYVPVKRIPTTDMREVTLDSWGNATRLVVQKLDFSFDSFTFLGDRGVIVDAERAKTAATFLKPQLRP